MANLVSIKSLKDGLSIKLDPEADFNEVYSDLCDKFRESAKFFGEAKVVVTFEGREITNDEEQALIDGITLNSNLTVLCVIGKDEEKNERFLRASNTFVNSGDTTDGQYYRGTLRAHENLETDTSIIILGDVNPGASVTSKGNIVILGTLYGTAKAGSGGNTGSFVVTLDMKSARVEIADVVSEVVLRASVFTKNKITPRISYINGREIVTEEISRDLLNNLPI
ncbi:MAG: septum site-determining protein MinC [Lachnospiraceae bacterium]|nr:septum site-determining protein MinC [Lachnospiraceae bacterium]